MTQLAPHLDELREIITNTTYYCGNVKEVVGDYLYEEGIEMDTKMFDYILENCSQDAFRPIDPFTLACFKD